MSDKPKAGADFRPLARTEDPLEPSSDNPSQNSKIHAATANQSSVDPDDYPAKERKAAAELSKPTP